MSSTCYSCQILIKLESSRQTFENFSSIKLHENTYSRSRVVPCGRVDRQMDMYEEANSHSSKFCERAKKFFVLPTECISVCCMDLQISGDFFPCTTSTYWFLDAFAKLLLLTWLCLSVSPSTWNTSAPIGRIFTTLDI